MSRLILVKNAFANICRGGAAALVMLLMPPFLTRILHKDAYSAWLLVMQLGTYVSVLDFGIQTAVGRYVAHHNELGEHKQRDSVVSTALAILIGLGGFAMLGTSILTWQLPNLFREMPVELHHDAQFALLFLGGSLAIALPFSVFGGIFIGLQRYDIPAWIIGVSKLLGGLFVILIANASHSIIMMAVVMGITNIGSGIWQFLAYKKIANDIQIDKNKISSGTAREISSYCFSLSIWTVAMMLITGFDTVIVGYFDYKSVVHYTLAATLTSFVMGVQNSVTAVLMPLASTIGAKQDSESLGSLLISGTKYSVIIMILMGLPFMLWGKYLLTLWVGSVYASDTVLILQLLLTGNFIRQIGGVYSTIALAVGEQKKIILSPLLEGIINIVISVLATAHFGFLGVAAGTICGAMTSVILHFNYNLPRTKSIKVKNLNLLLSAVFRPLFSIIPAVLFIAINANIDLSSSLYIVFSLICNFVSWILLWEFGFSNVERGGIFINVDRLIPSFLRPK
jgi:O-antigen/teichoic acid export membrane protein